MKRINLLPQNKQTELYYENLFHSVSVAAILATIILLLGILIQIGVWIYLNRTEARVSAEVEQLRQQTDKTENAELKQQIKLINNQMGDFQNLASLSPEWSKVLASFAKLVPKNVKITQFSAEAKKGKIDITGYSPTREQVIELYNNINSDKDNFKDINYPLENVSKPTDVQFNFSFFIQDGVLVPKQ
jgi:Tfp pilus assembly protein PilN